MKMFLISGGHSLLIQDDTQPCRKGVRAKVLPDGVHGFDHDHTHDEAAMGASGRWRGQLDGVKQLTLDLHVTGRQVGADVRRLLDLLGDGTNEVILRVVDGEEVWQVVGHLSQVSNPDWHGTTPAKSVYCTLGAVLAVGRPVWRAPEARKITFTGTSASGVLSLPTRGDQPMWPKITIKGTTGGCRVRLTADSEWQELPENSGGWVLVTDPAYRRVSDAQGLLKFTGTVPYWHTPVAPRGGVGEIEVEPKAPATDYAVVVEYLEENSRAW